MGWHVWEKSKELGGLAGIGDEEDDIVLIEVSMSHGASLEEMPSDLANVSQIAVQCLGRMHEAARNPQALHRRYHLPPHQAALADTAYYELPSCLDCAGQHVHTSQQPCLGDSV